MKKTKHFNISVPELGDVPDITQVSNAISDLEDATAGALEIMKAEMQGTKITLTSVSRKTKRTGYYEGMSIRFKSPQDIEPNYLKTISVDGLGDQTLSVEYKVNRNEYIDIVYEENKFTAYPVVVQKTDSVSNNSSILVGTAKGVKTAYDKGVEALNKANQAQSSANKAQSTADDKVSKGGDTMTGTLNIKNNGESALSIINNGIRHELFPNGSYGTGINLMNGSTSHRLWLGDNGETHLDANNLKTSSKEVITAINELHDGKENAFEKKSGFNLDKTDSYEESNTNKLFTQKGANDLKREIDGKLPLSGGEMSGNIHNNTSSNTEGLYSFTRHGALMLDGFVGGIQANWYANSASFGIVRGGATDLYNNCLKLRLNDVLYDVYHSGYSESGFTTSDKTIKGAINELNSGIIKTTNNKMDNRDYSNELRDLNTIKKDGFYAGYKWSNCPVGFEGDIACVDVKRYTNDWVIQMFYALNSNGCYSPYMRAFTRGSVWTSWIKVITENDNLFAGVIGNSVSYIQTSGTKTINKVYIDKPTGKLYRPIIDTSDTQVTQNFRVVSILDNSNGIGFGQKYKKVGVPKDSRRTNNTGRPIFYAVTETSDGRMEIYVDDNLIAWYNSLNNDSPTSFIVPAGSTWYWTGTGSSLTVYELS